MSTPIIHVSEVYCVYCRIVATFLSSVDWFPVRPPAWFICKYELSWNSLFGELTLRLVYYILFAVYKCSDIVTLLWLQHLCACMDDSWRRNILYVYRHDFVIHVNVLYSAKSHNMTIRPLSIWLSGEENFQGIGFHRDVIVEFTQKMRLIALMLLIGPEISISFIDWTQLSRFYLKTETESSLRNVVFK
jgi:hypothetical protein